MRRLGKHFANMLLCALLFGLFSPVFDTASIAETYRSAWHWGGCFLATAVCYPVILYFEQWNPRKMYYCIDVLSVTLGAALATAGLLAAIVVVVIFLEGVALQIIALSLSIVMYLVLLYALGHRGVAVYDNGKIRVFRLRVRTYTARRLDDLCFEYMGNRCRITFVICGEPHVFRASARSARLCEKRLRELHPCR